MANACMGNSSVTTVVNGGLCLSTSSAKLPPPLLRFGRFKTLSSEFPPPPPLRPKDISCAGTKPISWIPYPEMSVYEINEGDRDSPAYLRLSRKDVSSVGDLVPFTNKLYTGDLNRRAGITSGICISSKHEPEKKGDRYEAIYSFYLGEYGHISVQGAYLTYEPTYLAIKGGSGIFAGAYGESKLNQISPKAGLITFYLKGIPQLPLELLGEVVPPSPLVEPAAAAKACAPGATLPDFTT